MPTAAAGTTSGPSRLAAQYVALRLRGQTVLYVTIEPDPAWPPALLAAWQARMDASTTGTCPCGARVRLLPRDGTTVVTMEHEPDCIVGDERFAEAVGRFELGRRS